jgi:hypothetical protein
MGIIASGAKRVHAHEHLTDSATNTTSQSISEALVDKIPYKD